MINKTIQHDNQVIEIGRIQYINVDPVYYHLNQYSNRLNINVISRPPAILNQLMAEGRLQISSVSSSAYARNFDDWLILPDLSITCYGKVMSVLLVSHYPLQDLESKTVLLTDESATAVDLVKLIFAQKGVKPHFYKTSVKSPWDLMNLADAGLVIGDAALKNNWRRHFEHVWDLCEIWNRMTGLPFVFGVWVVQRSFAKAIPGTIPQILKAFYRSKSDGIADISRITASAARKLEIPIDVCKEYYNCMTYNFGNSEYNALNAFFSGLYANEIIDRKPTLNFYQNKTEEINRFLSVS